MARESRNGAAPHVARRRADHARADPVRIDLLGLLHERGGQFSRGHRLIARFVLSHMDEAAFLTAAALAERCGTSEATTIRFAQALGFHGFPDFQAAVRALVRQKLGPGDKVRRTRPIPSETRRLLDEVSEKALDNVRETIRMQSPETLNTAVQTILSAKALYVIGLRGSAGAAQTFAFFLNQLRPHVRPLLEGGPILLESLVSLSAEDAIVAISVPRYTRGTIDALRFARKQGTRTIVITDSPLSPAAQTADIVLTAQIDAFFSNSYAPVMLLLDILAAAIFRRAPEAAHARLDAIEDLFRGHDFFFSTDLRLPKRKRG